MIPGALLFFRENVTIKAMEKEKIAKAIDHTYLKADATEADIRRICQEAKKYGFRGVCVNPRWAKLAKEELRGTEVKVIIVIDWPCGASSTEVRVFQAQNAEEDGADEIDPVMDIGSFKMGKHEDVLEDLRALARVLPTKVIIETGFLTDEEIKKAAELVKKSGAFCVKTSTGMEPKVDIDKKILHVRLIQEAVGEDFPIKAAGGIKAMKDAQRIVEAGANIIGTSAGLAILEGKEGSGESATY